MMIWSSWWGLQDPYWVSAHEGKKLIQMVRPWFKKARECCTPATDVLQSMGIMQVFLIWKSSVLLVIFWRWQTTDLLLENWSSRGNNNGRAAICVKNNILIHWSPHKKDQQDFTSTNSNQMKSIRGIRASLIVTLLY